MQRIIIIGASSHGLVCLDYLLDQGKNIIGFYDDNQNLLEASIYGYPILGDITSAIVKLKETDLDYILAVGDNEDRKKIAFQITKSCKRPPINLIHLSANISSRITIGYGNFIASGVVIKINTCIGDNIIINSGSMVGHDVVINDFAQVSPGCVLTGYVKIEEGAFLGAGTVVIPGKTIGAYAVVGAGAVVIHDIPPYSTAVGVPARIIKQGSGTGY